MNIQDLSARQSDLTEQLSDEEISVSKTKEELDRISTQLSELKETQDYGSFKFMLSKVKDVLEKITPKHKVLKARDINLGKESPTANDITFSVPYSNEECSDNNPCNTGVCERCSVLHFSKVMEKLLSSYYAK